MRLIENEEVYISPDTTEILIAASLSKKRNDLLEVLFPVLTKKILNADIQDNDMKSVGYYLFIYYPDKFNDKLIDSINIKYLDMIDAYMKKSKKLGTLNQDITNVLELIMAKASLDTLKQLMTIKIFLNEIPSNIDLYSFFSNTEHNKKYKKIILKRNEIVKHLSDKLDDDNKCNLIRASIVYENDGLFYNLIDKVDFEKLRSYINKHIVIGGYTKKSMMDEINKKISEKTSKTLRIEINESNKKTKMKKF